MLMQRPLQHWSMNQEQTGGRLRSRFHHLGASRWTPIGGMGAITQALRRSAEALGVTVRTEAAVEQVIVSGDRASGVVLQSGEEFRARTVMMNVNPKTALLDLVGAEHLDPSFRRRMENVRMRGSAFKAHFALDGLPRFKIARSAEENEQLAKCGFRMAGTVASMERGFAEAQLGRWTSEHPMLWGMIPSALDPTLTPPGKHALSVSVFYAPYELEAGKDWRTEREAYGRRIIEVLGEYIENLDSIILDARYFSPVDLEEKFGLTNAQASHGDVLPMQYFGNRPIAGWADYRTPVAGLYLCGSGTWPGNYVSGLAGLNATDVLLTDIADMDKARRHIERRLTAERLERQAESIEANEPEDAAV
jgi:phytoene dehydrogenase-like protein